MSQPKSVLRRARVQAEPSEPPKSQDVVIGADGTILEVVDRAAVPSSVQEIDVGGRLVVPGLVDAHQHLDKSRTRTAVDNPDGTLLGAITEFSKYAASVGRDALLGRARKTLDACIERGTVAMRTHANLDGDMILKAVECMVELREESRARARLQVAALLSGVGLRSGDTPRIWLEEAVSIGADAVGGSPALAEDPLEFLDMVFGVADRHGVAVDFHLDEHLDHKRSHFDAVIERTRALGLQGRVALGHCSVLSALPSREVARIADGLAAVGIGVVTLPAANLFLQGRDAPRLAPRGLTNVRALLEAGVTVAAACDNIQDPFIPTGSGDLLEIARWTLLAGHMPGNKLGDAFDMVSAAAARLLGFGGEYGIRPGARADLLIADADDADDLVASGPIKRCVMFGGEIVAGSV